MGFGPRRKEATMKICFPILSLRALQPCCNVSPGMTANPVEEGSEETQWRGTRRGLLVFERMAGRLATPLGHIKKKYAR